MNYLITKTCYYLTTLAFAASTALALMLLSGNVIIPQVMAPLLPDAAIRQTLAPMVVSKAVSLDSTTGQSSAWNEAECLPAPSWYTSVDSKLLIAGDQRAM